MPEFILADPSVYDKNRLSFEWSDDDIIEGAFCVTHVTDHAIGRVG
jgi:hypothetical protein